ncbi:MAG TPA: hypothetical protein VGM77_10400 [Gemmatimonadales bacterium]
MSRVLVAVALTVGMVPALAAQDKPTAAMQQSIAGKWTLDQSRSDTLGPAMMRGGFRSAIAGGRGGGGGGGGSGGKGTKGGKGGSAPPAPAASPDSAAVQGPAAPRERGDPRMAIILAEAIPGNTITFTVNDSSLTFANAAGEVTPWKTDGRKRQKAQMDGSVIETQAQWDGNSVELTRTIAGVATLKREFKPGKDGSLEVKETIESPTQKVEKKVVFTRAQ